MSEPTSITVQAPQQSGVVAAAGATAHDVVTTLGAQPVLLLIVLLNVAMIGAAAWFLLTQERYRHDERLQFIELISKCADGKP